MTQLRYKNNFPFLSILKKKKCHIPLFIPCTLRRRSSKVKCVTSICVYLSAVYCWLWRCASMLVACLCLCVSPADQQLNRSGPQRRDGHRGQGRLSGYTNRSARKSFPSLEAHGSSRSAVYNLLAVKTNRLLKKKKGYRCVKVWHKNKTLISSKEVQIEGKLGASFRLSLERIFLTCRGHIWSKLTLKLHFWVFLSSNRWESRAEEKLQFEKECICGVNQWSPTFLWLRTGQPVRILLCEIDMWDVKVFLSYLILLDNFSAAGTEL